MHGLAPFRTLLATSPARQPAKGMPTGSASSRRDPPESIGLDDGFDSAENGTMSSAADAERFGWLYMRVYDGFHRRQPPTSYVPSREALAVMTHLLGTGPLTISEACQHFGRSQAAMSEIVTRLESRGLLARMPDERDRRRHLVWLTPTGRQLQSECTRVLETECVAAAFEHLSSGERAALLDGLEKLVAQRPEPAGDSGRPDSHDSNERSEE